MRDRRGVPCERQPVEGQSPSQREQVELPARLPLGIRATIDGCAAFTANADSCDLNVIDVPLLYNMGAQIGRDVTTDMGDRSFAALGNDKKETTRR